MSARTDGEREGGVTMGALTDGLAWINEKHAAGAHEIGVSCNPIQYKIFLIADNERLVIECRATQREVRIIKDILHDHIAQLPPATPPEQRALPGGER